MRTVATHKRILILSDEIGRHAYSPRLRSLCDVLVAEGYHIVVFTEFNGQALDFEHYYPIKSFEYYKYSGIMRHIEWALKFMFNLIIDHKNRSFAKHILSDCRSEKSEFDAIICTGFHTFPHPAAAWLAKQLNIPFLCDIRDLAEQIGGSHYQKHQSAQRNPIYLASNQLYRNINIKRRNNALKQAHVLTTVSPWHQQFLKQINPSTSLIYNGYDANLYRPKHIQTKQFIIRYIGRLYGEEMQNPTLVFEALAELTQNHNDLSKYLSFEWYTATTSHDEILTLAKKYHIEQLTHVYNYVPLNNVPSLLNTSSVVLVLTNKPTKNGPFGVMTTKFFEALGCERPVLCVQSDKGCLAQVIQQTNAGLAGENIEQVKTFILEKYSEWKQMGYTTQEVNLSAKNSFSRQAEAQQFIQLLSQL